jgi:glycosyltransferase involved in cell wall biosynthesis
MVDGTAAVTVVIPCFNQARYLSLAIDSVRRQSGPLTSVLVVDDGSTDETAAEAARLGAPVFRQTNQGVSQARNTGLAMAEDEFVIFLDADDELMPDAAARGVEALRRAPDVTCAVGRCEGIDEAGTPMPGGYPDVDPADLYSALLVHNFVWCPAAAIFRRNALRDIGGFPTTMAPVADYALYLALAREGRLVDHGHIVARYRQHGASMSRNAVGMLHMVLAVLDRERRIAPARYRPTFARGRRQWSWWYGEQIVEQLRQDWRTRTIGNRQAAAVATLVRHCPRTVARHMARKASRLLLAREEASDTARSQTS